MQRTYLLRASLILLLITGSYLVLWSTTTRAHPQKEACSESMDECCKKKTDKEGSGEMIWETFSRQFIATSVTE